jgi:excinuclease UvrABC ATPase subunit
LANLSVDKAIDFLKNLDISQTQQKMVQKVFKNAVERLEFLQ